jgi:class 3 adenylate cyclase
MITLGGYFRELAKRLAALTEADAHSLERAEQRADLPSSPASAAIEAERRQVSGMFIDLVDSTALAERFDPEDMRRLLGVYYQACARAIEAREGRWRAAKHRAQKLARSIGRFDVQCVVATEGESHAAFYD